MKKVLTYLLAVVLGVACCFTFIGCGDEDVAGRHVYREIEIGSTLTTEQLVEKSKKETGNFIAYGNTSRITKAMDNFVAKYGSELGLTSSTAMAQKQDDSAIYTLLENEANNPGASGNASMVLIQDSASLIAHRNDSSNLLANYVPYGMQEYVAQNNLLPLAHQFINKLFMYNTAGDTNLKFDNVWTLTKAEYKDKIYFKSPKSEQVNLNFLIMLTSDEWSAKLETAYKKLNNNTAASDVGSGKTYKNYGYKWVAEFLKNCNFSINSDTTIAQDLSKESNAGKMGLFVLSKLRDESVQGDNLAVSAWDGGKEINAEYKAIEPFAGFMYSIYAQLCNNGPRPYTAMLFVNYLMTEEGFKPWASMGGYSSASNVDVTEGDSKLDFWQQTLVVENGEYINEVKTSVLDWINAQLQ